MECDLLIPSASAIYPLGADMRGAALALTAALMERLGCEWLLLPWERHDGKGKAPMTSGMSKASINKIIVLISNIHIKYHYRLLYTNEGSPMNRTDLLSLVIRLACVEIRMGVEDRSLAEVWGIWPSAIGPP
jgi:hypothetical protein